MPQAEAKKDKDLDLFAVRSVLFLPASNPRAIAKAREAGADLVVLDLEDAVKTDDKEAARVAAVHAVATPWPMPVAIRVNGVGTEWHSLDLDAVATSSADLIVLPRATSAHLTGNLAAAVSKPVLAMVETAAGVIAAAEIAAASAGLMPVAIRVNGVGTEWHSLDLNAVATSNANLIVLPRATSAHLTGNLAAAVSKPVFAMIETAAGVLAAPEIAAASAGLIAGTNDLRADLRLPLDASRDPIATALQLIVLAARAAGVAAFDGVFNKLDDVTGFEREAEDGRRLGFDGKSLIHPNQIAPCHRAFAPTPAEIERAEALVAAFDGGAERFGDEMIERMHVVAAQRILERATA